MKTQLKDLIANKTFVYGIEAVTARGLLQVEGEKTNSFTNEIMDSSIFDFVSITDNPGGNPQLAPECIGKSLLSKGHNVNIHVTCKDRNRNALETRAWQLASEGFTNILVLTGDYPGAGYRGVGRPVFDIDSVALLKMYTALNQGLGITIPGKDKAVRLSKTDFLLSATVSPFKKSEAEYLTQYFKMEKKVRAGAQYFIIQIGYDVKKWSELLMYAQLNNIHTPLIANIYLLTKGVAKLFHDGKIAGCVVSPALLDLVQKKADSHDKGKGFFLEFAAMQMAIAKGMGFNGCYLGGVHNINDVNKIKETVDSYGPDDWKEFYKEISFPLPSEFALYKKDANGFALPEYKESYTNSKKSYRRFFQILCFEPPMYRLSRLVHNLIFEEKSPLYNAMKTFYGIIDGKSSLEKFFHFFEYSGKVCLYGCHNCGDCSLLEVAYLCPEDKCSKNQRNGPCGGSYRGICEVGDKMCIWYKAYKRLKPHNYDKEPFKGDITITDAQLLHTSGWQNYFLKRDHKAQGGKA